jgi:hypothetical protein
MREKFKLALLSPRMPGYRSEANLLKEGMTTWEPT